MNRLLFKRWPLTPTPAAQRAAAFARSLARAVHASCDLPAKPKAPPPLRDERWTAGRRGVLAGLLAATMAAPAALATPVPYWAKPHGVGLPVSSIRGTAYTWGPLLRPADIWRTTLVDQNDEQIDLQDEVAIPASPTVALWTISGSDSQYFRCFGGILTIKPSRRAELKALTAAGQVDLSVTVTAANLYGGPVSTTLTIHLAQDSKCRFISASGSDANLGTTPQAPWAHTPRSSTWTGTGGAGNGPQMTAGGTVFFYKSERHPTQIFNTVSSSSGVDHQGVSYAQPHVYSARGWGSGRARLCGDDQLPNAWTFCTSAADCGGNPNWASIEKTTISTPFESFQKLYFGETMGYMAQYPAPDNLSINESPALTALNGSQAAGWKRARVSLSPSDTFTPRIYRSGGTVPTGGSAPGNGSTAVFTGSSTVQIIDPALNSYLGSSPLGDGSSFVGFWIALWSPGNNVTWYQIYQWDPSTSTATVVGVIGSGIDFTNVGGTYYTSYALLGPPAAIAKQGQFAVSQDGLTLYAWRPNTDLSTMSVRAKAAAMTANFVTVQGFQLERYATGIGRAGAASAGYCGFYHGKTNAILDGFRLSDILVRQSNAAERDPCVLYVSGGDTQGFTKFIIERIRVRDCGRSAAMKASARMQGSTGTSAPNGGPSKAEIIAEPRGKVRWCRIEPLAIDGTFFVGQHISGVEFSENLTQSQNTTHGNGISLTSDGAGTYAQNCLIRFNVFDNQARAITTSDNSGAGASRYTTYERNIMLGGGDGVSQANATMNLSGNDPDSVIQQNLMLRANDTYYSINLAQGVRTQVKNNVMTGVLGAVGAGSSWDIENNLVTDTLIFANNGVRTSASLPNNSGAMVVANNAFMTDSGGTAIYTWDVNTAIPAAWQGVLGSGQVGIFAEHTVP